MLPKKKRKQPVVVAAKVQKLVGQDAVKSRGLWRGEPRRSERLESILARTKFSKSG